MRSHKQIHNLEREIQEKRRQMRALEQKITETGEASLASASMVDMQQVLLFCAPFVVVIIHITPMHLNFQFSYFCVFTVHFFILCYLLPLNAS